MSISTRLAQLKANDNPSSNGMAALLLAVLLLSIGPSVVRSAESHQLVFVAWRMVLGAIAYYMFMRLRGKNMSLVALRDGFWGGVAFGTSTALGYSAIANTSIANAQIIGGLRPVAILVITGVLLGERVRAISVMWTLIAISGISLMVVGAGNSGTNSLIGDSLAVGSMLSGTIFLFCSRKARSRQDTMTYSTAMTIVAALVLMPVAAIAEGSLSPIPVVEDWPRIALMVALPGVGHVLNNYSIGYVKLHVVSSVNLLLPVMAALVAWVVVNEALVVAQMIGMAVTVVALFPLVREEQARLQK
ncbi:MAG: DMT family transporter [bacterium]|nr:DMT family transporter [bacterium]